MQKSLLLVVDVQNGFMNEATEHVLPVINKLIKTWQRKGWPIVCSRFVNIEGSNWETLRDWHRLKGEPDTALAAGFQVDTPYIFKKSTYSAWDSDVLAVTSAHDVRDVVIAGIDTNECVLATAIGVFDSGYTPWLVEDACASTGGAEVHATAIGLLQALLGKQQIITSEEAA